MCTTQPPARMPAGTRAQPRTRTHVPALSHASARGGRCCFPSLFTSLSLETRGELRLGAGFRIWKAFSGAFPPTLPNPEFPTRGCSEPALISVITAECLHFFANYSEIVMVPDRRPPWVRMQLGPPLHEKK